MANKTGYAHSVYFGKTSGHFNFNVWQDLSNSKYDNSDLAYFTNNNEMHNGIWMGYNWTKPTKWYNRLGSNINAHVLSLVSPIDILKRKSMMFESFRFNYNLYGQLKIYGSLG